MFRTMNLSIAIGLVIHFIGIGALHADCRIPKMPLHFTLEEAYVSLSTKFSISSSSGKMGTVSQRIFGLTTTFDYNDENGNPIATAKKEAFSWGTEISVYDCDQKKIGTIKERLFSSFMGVTSVYLILDNSGKQVATSKKVELGTTSFTLTDSGEREIATLERPYLRMKDSWEVQMTDASEVDPRLIVMIGAYKTSADNQKK